MEFETEAQKACYEKVAGYMTSIFGEQVYADPGAPLLWVRYGSAHARVDIWPWGTEDSVIAVRSWVVTGVEMSQDLAVYLLQQNNNMRFGAFGLDRSNNIFFHHSIVGSTCDKQELRTSVMAVLLTADDSDDEIVKRWGGLRAVDRKA